MPGHYEMSFGERGRGSGVSRSPSRSPARTERDFQRQQRESDSDNRAAARAAAAVQQQLAAAAAARRQREQEAAAAAAAAAEAQRAAEAEAIRQAEARMAALPARSAIDPATANAALAALQLNLSQAPTYGALSPALDAAGFRAQEAARSMGLNQRQAGFDAYQAMLSDAAAAAQSNIAAASPGLFGAPTRFMNERFLEGLNSRIGGRDSEAYQLYLSDPNLFSPVYDTTGRLTGYRDEYGRLTGRDPIAEEEERRMRQGDGEPEITGTVTDPATGEEKCPDGYIFDEDLQACRKKPMERTTVDTTPGERFVRSGLLDVAPEGLMGFQERYGAGFGSPMDFASANRAFRMGGAVTPSFFSTPPKLDGYTLLA